MSDNQGRTFGAIRIFNKRGVREPVATMGVWPTSDGACMVAVSRVHPKDTFNKGEGQRRVAARLKSVAHLSRSSEALDRIYHLPTEDLDSEDGRLCLALLLSSRVIICPKSALRDLRKSLTSLLGDSTARFRLLREFGFDGNTDEIDND